MRTSTRIKNDLSHWESWAGLLLLVVFIIAGSNIGVVYGHSTLGVAIGALLGAFLFSRAIDYVETRYVTGPR